MNHPVWSLLSRHLRQAVLALSLGGTLLLTRPAQAQFWAVPWSGYARDPQHTALSSVPSQPLKRIRWQTPVDLFPQYSGNDLFIHYGSPLVTKKNTVIVPVKNGVFDGFQLEAHSGSTGALKWKQVSDYSLPYNHDWTPSYSPTLTPRNRLYFAGIGGTVNFRDNPDASGAAPTGKIAFYGLNNYNASPSDYQNNVFINTPLTSDLNGNIYFGFEVLGSTPIGLQSGIARIGADGKSTWVSVTQASGDLSMFKVAHNCAPALGNDGKTLYIAVNNGSGSGYANGRLLALDSKTLTTLNSVYLYDIQYGMFGYSAVIDDDGTASPTVGPDGDVYFGVLEAFFGTNHLRGWLLHFNSDLTQQKAPGAFGWDDSASIVPARMVPAYQGASKYLLMTKYNNYVEGGGDGVNKIAVLDPNDTQTDLVTGETVMKEVYTIAGATPDDDFVPFGFPNAVREWCINTAAVDPFTKSILANSEDGKLYRWDMTTNSFTEVITLTPGIGEAYTPTVIGVDGTVYAINNATLFAVGK